MPHMFKSTWGLTQHYNDQHSHLQDIPTSLSNTSSISQSSSSVSKTFSSLSEPSSIFSELSEPGASQSENVDDNMALSDSSDNIEVVVEIFERYQVSGLSESLEPNTECYEKFDSGISESVNDPLDIM